MKEKVVATAMAMCLSVAVFAQKADISGFVHDERNDPVVGASVHLLNTLYGSYTDRDGRFFLSIEPGTYDFHISAPGFANLDKRINTTETAELDIQLTISTRQLDDVVVTAQKEEENLQEVPFSTTAFSSRQVQAFRMWNADAVSAIVPNLYSANPGDNRNVTSIRGITSSSYDPAVATYIDGVNQFSLDTYIPQLFDIERIEVLRGPQGTLYGRNAMGGVIHIHTRQPSNRIEGFAEANFGQYGQQRYTIGFRTPLVNNKLFFGAAGLFDKADGFYTNVFDNSDFDKRKSFTGNYYMTYAAGAEWAFTLNIKNNIHRNNGAFPLAYDRVYEVNQNATTTLIDNSFNGSFLASYAGTGFNFTSQTTFQNNHRYYNEPIDGDFSPIDGITIINNYGKDWNNVKVWTQEFKFTSPAASMSKINWTGGIYLFAQDNPVKQATRFGNDAAYVGADDTNFSIINTSVGESKGGAVYGQGTYKLTDRFEVTLGARYDYERKEQGALAEYQHDPDPNPVFDILPDTTATASYQAFSPKVSLLYRLSSSSNVYAVYSKGFRAGGLTQLSGDPSAPPLYEYKPEFSNSYEIGVKNTFLDNTIQLNVAAFHTKVTDAQVPTLVLPEALTVTQNAGELTSSGAEVEFLATLFKGFQVNLNLGLTEAKYNTLTLPVKDDDDNLYEGNFKGNRQIFTPETTAMLAVQYNLPLNNQGTMDLVARAEWMHLGEQYFDLANNIKQSPYSLVNVRAGLAGKHWEVMLWGRNLGDEKYVAYAYDFGAMHLGEPVNWGITLSGRF